MKTLKPYFFKSIAAILLFFSCNIEPYEGDVTDDTVTITCGDATKNVIQATTDYTAANPEDPNYTSLCNAYKKALEDQISACGDSNNTVKQLIEQLGDCGATTTEDCETIEAETEAAETAFNNATIETYLPLCSAYKEALQSEINSCGDDDGVLQTKMDQLNDCNYVPNTCEEAIALTAVTKTAFENTSAENYTNLCNAYKAALQQQISLCGDEDGVLQVLIDALEDCELDIDTTDCNDLVMYDFFGLPIICTSSNYTGLTVSQVYLDESVYYDDTDGDGEDDHYCQFLYITDGIIELDSDNRIVSIIDQTYLLEFNICFAGNDASNGIISGEIPFTGAPGLNETTDTYISGGFFGNEGCDFLCDDRTIITNGILEIVEEDGIYNLCFKTEILFETGCFENSYTGEILPINPF